MPPASVTTPRCRYGGSLSGGSLSGQGLLPGGGSLLGSPSPPLDRDPRLSAVKIRELEIDFVSTEEKNSADVWEPVPTVNSQKQTFDDRIPKLAIVVLGVHKEY